MAELYEIYKCEICGNMVEVLHAGAGELVCCGEPMVQLEALTEDKGKEKHVPVVEKVDGGIKVKLGEVPHPMTEEHHIEWIAIVHQGTLMRKFLSPTDVAEAIFRVDDTGVQAWGYCNLHGLWTNKCD